VNTAWNITNSSTARISRPAAGLSSTSSILPVTVSGRSGGFTQALKMRWACAWAARISLAVGFAPGVGGLAGVARRQGLDLGDQLFQSALAGRHRGDDRRADLGRQLLQIDPQALALGDVEHVERQHERPADLLELQRQAQDQPQVGGVGHADQHPRSLLAGQTAQDGVARHHLVGAAGAQGIGAGQIEHAQGAAAGRVQHAFLPLDGNARVVGDLLAAAGQGVEQGGLAGIGIADQRDAGGARLNRVEKRLRWE
jgi:hypothetical protein